MSKYNGFLAMFVISIIAFIFFMACYLHLIFAFVFNAHEYRTHLQPWDILGQLMSAPVIISAAILGISNLAYRIMGIVYVAKSNTVKEGEKALWIIGFVLIGFITAIVFLILARDKKFVE